MMSSQYLIEIIEILHVSFVQYYAALMMASIIIYMYAMQCLLYIICTGKGIKQC